MPYRLIFVRPARPRLTVIFFLPCVYRLHIVESSSRISDARVRQRVLDDAVQHVGVLVRVLGQPVSTGRSSERLRAEPVLQHATATARQALGIVQRRQVRFTGHFFLPHSKTKFQKSCPSVLCTDIFSLAYVLRVLQNKVYSARKLSSTGSFFNRLLNRFQSLNY